MLLRSMRSTLPAIKVKYQSLQPRTETLFLSGPVTTQVKIAFMREYSMPKATMFVSHSMPWVMKSVENSWLAVTQPTRRLTLTTPATSLWLGNPLALPVTFLLPISMPREIYFPIHLSTLSLLILREFPKTVPADFRETLMSRLTTMESLSLPGTIS